MNPTSMQIVKLSDIEATYRDSILKQVEDIFFLSSSLKSFSSEERKLAFYKRWCGDYQTLYPDEFFIVMEGEKVMGYLSGCSDSLQAEAVLSVPGFGVFHDLFIPFPAHLHINFHPDARGKGFGSLLVQHYLLFLKQKGVSGVHLVTSPDAQNVSFYERLGFTHTYTRNFNGMKLHLMGAFLTEVGN